MRGRAGVALYVRVLSVDRPVDDADARVDVADFYLVRTVDVVLDDLLRLDLDLDLGPRPDRDRGDDAVDPECAYL